MFERLLTVNNFYWSGERFLAPLALDRDAALRDAVAPGLDAGVAVGLVQGRFACVSTNPDGRVALARDRLGLNKLFLCMHESGKVVAANYLIDLVGRGVPFECIYSVPAGYIVRIDTGRQLVELQTYVRADEPLGMPDLELEDAARRIRTQLEMWFSRLADQLGERRIHVCLSGGLDSGLIAALARRYFSKVSAYTYAFATPGGQLSEDASNAERLAEALRIPLRVVIASEDDVVGAIDNAICFGQDWRDFNVHCAIVNEILARAIREDRDGEAADADSLVMTGDLANELLADYAPVPYDGRKYYELPHVDSARLRLALVRGLDAGDREVGIFAHHGLDLIQPYGFVADEYMRVPGSLVGRDGFKQALSRRIGGDLLPGFVFDRVKVRAQIGSSSEPVGILPVLIRRGYDARWLRSAFCRLFGIRDEGFLNAFVRAGRYRIVNRGRGGRSMINGYIAA